MGESAPVSGDFFYEGDTMMLRNTKQAVEQAFGTDGNFLKRFKSYGWYLDDLVLVPINKLSRSERKAKWRESQGDLTARIAEYQPEAIVSMLRCIDSTVNAAADAAGSRVPRYVVPFPGMGHQRRFLSEMAKILPKLPRAVA